MEKELNYNKVSIIGLGKTGIAVANYLSRKNKKVFISEVTNEENNKSNLKLINRSIGYELGGHTEKVLDSELIIKSPGVRSDMPVLIKAKQKNIKIVSEIEFVYGIIKPKELIAITGTNGKTTTTTMVGEIFKNAGADTVVCGNIGAPISDFIEEITGKTVVVLEVSSYQLEDTETFKPDVACVLNVTPDHLEHHSSMESYISSKTRILKNQTDKGYCILNYDDRIVRGMADKCRSNTVFFSQDVKQKKGAFYGNGILDISYPNIEKVPLVLKIPGKHNIENAVASFLICAVSNIDSKIIKKTLENFKGVKHRIELVREINAVKYINDSKSTNVDSTLVALRSFEKNIILIMGGRDKGAPYSPLKDIVKERVKKLLLVGEAAGKIKHDLGGATELVECGDIGKAVEYANEVATRGDIVLLSPGCSSFDQFTNFEERGRYFKKIVNGL